MGVSSSALSFISRPGMLSEPIALCGLICCSSFRTPFCVTSNLCISGCGLGPKFGRSVMFSVVKTDENCSLRTRALLMLSLCSLPSLSSDATPVSSQHLLLMYCQNVYVVGAFCDIQIASIFKDFVSAPVTCVHWKILPFYKPLTSF